jgi:hypothetical protein
MGTQFDDEVVDGQPHNDGLVVNTGSLLAAAASATLMGEVKC